MTTEKAEGIRLLRREEAADHGFTQRKARKDTH